jgi:hypothetical protein
LRDAGHMGVSSFEYQRDGDSKMFRTLEPTVPLAFLRPLFDMGSVLKRTISFREDLPNPAVVSVAMCLPAPGPQFLAEEPASGWAFG